MEEQVVIQFDTDLFQHKQYQLVVNPKWRKLNAYDIASYTYSVLPIPKLTAEIIGLFLVTESQTPSRPSLRVGEISVFTCRGIILTTIFKIRFSSWLNLRLLFWRNLFVFFEIGNLFSAKISFNYFRCWEIGELNFYCWALTCPLLVLGFSLLLCSGVKLANLFWEIRLYLQSCNFWF